MPTEKVEARAKVQEAHEQLQRAEVRDWFVKRLERVGGFIHRFPNADVHGFEIHDDPDGCEFSTGAENSEELKLIPPALNSKLALAGFDLNKSVGVLLSTSRADRSLVDFSFLFTQSELSYVIGDKDAKSKLEDDERAYKLDDQSLAQAITSVELLESCQEFLTKLVGRREMQNQEYNRLQKSLPNIIENFEILCERPWAYAYWKKEINEADGIRTVTRTREEDTIGPQLAENPLGKKLKEIGIDVNETFIAKVVIVDKGDSKAITVSFSQGEHELTVQAETPSTFEEIESSSGSACIDETIAKLNFLELTQEYAERVVRLADNQASFDDGVI